PRRSLRGRRGRRYIDFGREVVQKRHEGSESKRLPFIQNRCDWQFLTEESQASVPWLHLKPGTERFSGHLVYAFLVEHMRAAGPNMVSNGVRQVSEILTKCWRDQAHE